MGLQSTSGSAFFIYLTTSLRVLSSKNYLSECMFKKNALQGTSFCVLFPLVERLIFVTYFCFLYLGFGKSMWDSRYVFKLLIILMKRKTRLS